nr:MAG: hypothetical protein [Skomarfal virus 2]
MISELFLIIFCALVISILFRPRRRVKSNNLNFVDHQPIFTSKVNKDFFNTLVNGFEVEKATRATQTLSAEPAPVATSTPASPEEGTSQRSRSCERPVPDGRESRRRKQPQSKQQAEQQRAVTYRNPPGILVYNDCAGCRYLANKGLSSYCFRHKRVGWHWQGLRQLQGLESRH